MDFSIATSRTKQKGNMDLCDSAVIGAEGGGGGSTDKTINLSIASDGKSFTDKYKLAVNQTKRDLTTVHKAEFTCMPFTNCVLAMHKDEFAELDMVSTVSHNGEVNGDVGTVDFDLINPGFPQLPTCIQVEHTTGYGAGNAMDSKIGLKMINRGQLCKTAIILTGAQHILPEAQKQVFNDSKVDCVKPEALSNLVDTFKHAERSIEYYTSGHGAAIKDVDTSFTEMDDDVIRTVWENHLSNIPVTHRKDYVMFMALDETVTTLYCMAASENMLKIMVKHLKKKKKDLSGKGEHHMVVDAGKVDRCDGGGRENCTEAKGKKKKTGKRNSGGGNHSHSNVADGPRKQPSVPPPKNITNTSPSPLLLSPVAFNMRINNGFLSGNVKHSLATRKETDPDDKTAEDKKKEAESTNVSKGYCTVVPIYTSSDYNVKREDVEPYLNGVEAKRRFTASFCDLIKNYFLHQKKNLTELPLNPKLYSYMETIRQYHNPNTMQLRPTEDEMNSCRNNPFYMHTIFPTKMSYIRACIDMNTLRGESNESYGDRLSDLDRKTMLCTKFMTSRTVPVAKLRDGRGGMNMYGKLKYISPNGKEQNDDDPNFCHNEEELSAEDLEKRRNIERARVEMPESENVCMRQLLKVKLDKLQKEGRSVVVVVSDGNEQRQHKSVNGMDDATLKNCILEIEQSVATSGFDMDVRMMIDPSCAVHMERVVNDMYIGHEEFGTATKKNNASNRKNSAKLEELKRMSTGTWNDVDAGVISTTPPKKIVVTTDASRLDDGDEKKVIKGLDMFGEVPVSHISKVFGKEALETYRALPRTTYTIDKTTSVTGIFFTKFAKKNCARMLNVAYKLLAVVTENTMDVDKFIFGIHQDCTSGEAPILNQAYKWNGNLSNRIACLNESAWSTLRVPFQANMRCNACSSSAFYNFDKKQFCFCYLIAAAITKVSEQSLLPIFVTRQLELYYTRLDTDFNNANVLDNVVGKSGKTNFVFLCKQNKTKMSRYGNIAVCHDDKDGFTYAPRMGKTVSTDTSTTPIAATSSTGDDLKTTKTDPIADVLFGSTSDISKQSNCTYSAESKLTQTKLGEIHGEMSKGSGSNAKNEGAGGGDEKEGKHKYLRSIPIQNLLELVNAATSIFPDHQRIPTAEDVAEHVTKKTIDLFCTTNAHNESKDRFYADVFTNEAILEYCSLVMSDPTMKRFCKALLNGTEPELETTTAGEDYDNDGGRMKKTSNKKHKRSRKHSEDENDEDDDDNEENVDSDADDDFDVVVDNNKDSNVSSEDLESSGDRYSLKRKKRKISKNRAKKSKQCKKKRSTKVASDQPESTVTAEEEERKLKYEKLNRFISLINYGLYLKMVINLQRRHQHNKKTTSTNAGGGEYTDNSLDTTTSITGVSDYDQLDQIVSDKVIGWLRALHQVDVSRAEKSEKCKDTFESVINEFSQNCTAVAIKRYLTDIINYCQRAFTTTAEKLGTTLEKLMIDVRMGKVNVLVENNNERSMVKKMIGFSDPNSVSSPVIRDCMMNQNTMFTKHTCAVAAIMDGGDVNNTNQEGCRDVLKRENKGGPRFSFIYVDKIPMRVTQVCDRQFEEAGEGDDCNEQRDNDPDDDEREDDEDFTADNKTLMVKERVKQNKSLPLLNFSDVDVPNRSVQLENWLVPGQFTAKTSIYSTDWSLTKEMGKENMAHILKKGSSIGRVNNGSCKRYASNSTANEMMSATDRQKATAQMLLNYKKKCETEDVYGSGDTNNVSGLYWLNSQQQQYTPTCELTTESSVQLNDVIQQPGLNYAAFNLDNFINPQHVKTAIAHVCNFFDLKRSELPGIVWHMYVCIKDIIHNVSASMKNSCDKPTNELDKKLEHFRQKNVVADANQSTTRGVSEWLGVTLGAVGNGNMVGQLHALIAMSLQSDIACPIKMFRGSDLARDIECKGLFNDLLVTTLLNVNEVMSNHNKIKHIRQVLLPGCENKPMLTDTNTNYQTVGSSLIYHGVRTKSYKAQMGGDYFTMMDAAVPPTEYKGKFINSMAQKEPGKFMEMFHIRPLNASFKRQTFHEQSKWGDNNKIQTTLERQDPEQLLGAIRCGEVTWQTLARFFNDKVFQGVDLADENYVFTIFSGSYPKFCGESEYTIAQYKKQIFYPIYQECKKMTGNDTDHVGVSDVMDVDQQCQSPVDDSDDDDGMDVFAGMF